jgi:hypothetical protein
MPEAGFELAMSAKSYVRGAVETAGTGKWFR